MKFKFLFRWYDLWIGCFINTDNHKIYVFPFPMIGLKIDYSKFHEEILFTHGSLWCWFYGHTYKKDEIFCTYCGFKTTHEGLWIKYRIMNNVKRIFNGNKFR